MAPVADSSGPARPSSSSSSSSTAVPPAHAQIFLRTDSAAPSSSSTSASSKLKVHLPTTLKDRAKLSSLLKRHGADVEANWRSAHVIVLDLNQAPAARHLFRQARSLAQPIPVVTEDWIMDSVHRKAMADVEDPKYNAIRKLDEREAKKQSTAAAAAASSSAASGPLPIYKMPGRMGYTQADRDLIVEHLCVTREPWSGFAVAKELAEISGGRHSATSFQTHLRDNLTKNRRYRFLAEERMRQRRREAAGATEAATSVGGATSDNHTAAGAATTSTGAGSKGQIGARLAFHDKAPTARAKAEAEAAKQAEHDRREQLRRQQASDPIEDEEGGEPDPSEEELPRGARASGDDVETAEAEEEESSDSGEQEADEVDKMLDGPGKEVGLEERRKAQDEDGESSRAIEEETEPVDGWDQPDGLDGGGGEVGESEEGVEGQDEEEEGGDEEEGDDEDDDDEAQQSRSAPEKFTQQDRQTLGAHLCKLLSTSLEGGTVSEEEVDELIKLSPSEAENKRSIDVLHPPHSFFRELEKDVPRHSAPAWKAHHAKNRTTYLELAKALWVFGMSQGEEQTQSQSQSQGQSQSQSQSQSQGEGEAQSQSQEGEEEEDGESEEDEEQAEEGEQIEADAEGEQNETRDASTEAGEEQEQVDEAHPQTDEEQSQDQLQDEPQTDKEGSQDDEMAEPEDEDADRAEAQLTGMDVEDGEPNDVEASSMPEADEQDSEQEEEEDPTNIPSAPPSTTKSQRTIHHDAKVALRSEVVAAKEERLATIASPTPARILKETGTSMTQPLDTLARGGSKRRMTDVEFNDAATTPSKRHASTTAKRARHTLGGPPNAPSVSSPLRSGRPVSRHAFVDFSGEAEEKEEEEVDEMDGGEAEEKEVEEAAAAATTEEEAAAAPQHRSVPGLQKAEASTTSMQPPARKRIPLGALVPPSVLGLVSGHAPPTTRVSSATFGGAVAIPARSPGAVGASASSAQQKIKDWNARSSSSSSNLASKELAGGATSIQKSPATATTSDKLRRSVGDGGRGKERGGSSASPALSRSSTRHARTPTDDDMEEDDDLYEDISGADHSSSRDRSPSRAVDRLRRQVRTFIQEYHLPSIAKGLPFLLKANGDLPSARRRMEARLQKLGRTYGMERERVMEFVREAKGDFEIAEGFMRIVGGQGKGV